MIKTGHLESLYAAFVGFLSSRTWEGLAATCGLSCPDLMRPETKVSSIGLHSKHREEIYFTHKNAATVAKPVHFMLQFCFTPSILVIILDQSTEADMDTVCRSCAGMTSCLIVL